MRKTFYPAGLKTIRPYAIEDGWEESPDDIPYLRWSDLTLFMVSTPSPDTKYCLMTELFFQRNLANLQHFFINAKRPEIIGKWYSRKPIADEMGIVSEPPAGNTSI